MKRIYRRVFKVSNDLFALTCAKNAHVSHEHAKKDSTAALSAFEMAARHQSFTKAADELAVTQAQYAVRSARWKNSSA